ncbi:MAG TPA: hypothetical protein VJ180_15585, partial [Pyrinomonadaceae bacterium]|nr:hypothetical protein [Pyrinomonadaceae bacterium]
RAFEQGSPERRRSIGAAIVGSGLANKTIDKLSAENREDTYIALCLLFVMAKSGEIQSLVQAIEEHENFEVRRAVIKLLSLSGHADSAAGAAKRRLMDRPTDSIPAVSQV